MYKALVVRIQTKPHPNADKLLLGNVSGYQIVVNDKTQDGQLGVFFGPDGQLSEEYATVNDLIGYIDPETGEKKGGYFPKNRRVRAQALRGEKSEGFFAPLHSLEYTGYNLSLLKEGDQFDELNGHKICQKYVTPSTAKEQAKNAQLVKTNKFFAKHFDTPKLKDELDFIETDSVAYFTEKLHGTSGRFGYVLDLTIPERSRLQRFLDGLLGRKQKVHAEYKHLLGTRNVILKSLDQQSFYENENFRFKSVEQLYGKLHRGEILYYEIVGYVSEEQPIMSPQSTKELKEIKKQYGSTINYSYGQIPGQCKIYVYRITKTDENGHVIEYSWNDVKRRCNELGIDHVPQLIAPILLRNQEPGVHALEVADMFVEGPSVLDSSHIREGVAVRIESVKGSQVFKYKSFTFGVLEGYLKNNDNYVDLEESS